MYKLLLAIVGCLLAFAVQAQSWRGAYAGVSLGGFKAKSTWTTDQLGGGINQVCPPNCLGSQDADFSANGYYAGAHAGYNWVLGGHWLLGLEGGFGNTNAKGSIDHTPGWLEANQSDRIDATFEYSGSIVARLGLAAGPLVLYGVAGPSWQKVSLRYQCSGDPIGNASWCLSARNEKKADVWSGWTAGGGAEWRLSNRVSARLDYRYSKYKARDFEFFANTPAQVDTVFAHMTLRTHVLGIGASYRF